MERHKSKHTKGQKLKKERCRDESFNYLDKSVSIRQTDEDVELVIDTDIYSVRFLKNGRPYTSAFVNVMATSVKDYAERFITFTRNQHQHWAEVNAEREKSRKPIR